MPAGSASPSTPSATTRTRPRRWACAPPGTRRRPRFGGGKRARTRAGRDVRRSCAGGVGNEDGSLAAPPGRIYGLIGPNGSGKATLFDSIVGRHPVDGGSLRLEGREITRLRVP